MTEIEYPSQAGLSEEQKEIDRQVLQYVLAGIELLNKRYGPDWADKIDLDTLHLCSGHTCVLGQLYGDWARGTAQLGIGSKDGLYGFSTLGLSGSVLESYDEDGESYFAMLDRIWQREIAALRS